MRTRWMVIAAVLCGAFLAPGVLAGQFGYTFDCDGAAANAAGDPFEVAISRHQVPNTADILYFVQIILPLTDTVIEEELFLGTDNFISWAADQFVFNAQFHAEASTSRVQLHMDGAQTGKSVSGQGEFVVDGRSYTFAAWPKTSLQ
jgi:hypothetical protein